MSESHGSEEFDTLHYLQNILIAGKRYRMWWRMLLKHDPSYADQCPIWELFDADDWMSILSKQPALAERCSRFDLLPCEELLLLSQQHPQLKILLNKKLNADKLRSIR